MKQTNQCSEVGFFGHTNVSPGHTFIFKVPGKIGSEQTHESFLTLRNEFIYIRELDKFYWVNNDGDWFEISFTPILVKEIMQINIDAEQEAAQFAVRGLDDIDQITYMENK